MEEDVFDATKVLRKFYVAYSDSLTESVATSIKTELDAQWDKDSNIPEIILCDKKMFSKIANSLERTDRILVIGNFLAEKAIPNPCVKDVFCKHGVHIRIQGHKCVFFIDNIKMKNLKNLECELGVAEGTDDKLKRHLTTSLGLVGQFCGDKVYSMYRRIYPLKVKSALQYRCAEKIFLKDIFKGFVLDEKM